MGSNELIITELVFNNQLTERPPEEIAALLSRKFTKPNQFTATGTGTFYMIWYGTVTDHTDEYRYFISI
jgi:superfamily II RNA helicase